LRKWAVQELIPEHEKSAISSPAAPKLLLTTPEAAVALRVSTVEIAGKTDSRRSDGPGELAFHRNTRKNALPLRVSVTSPRAMSEKRTNKESPLMQELEESKSATLPVHKAIESSNERGLMARKRYQKGSVFLSGKNKDKWIGRYREDVIRMDGKTRRLRRDSILGTKRELPTKRLAQRRLDAILARINGLDYRATRVATFEEFLERWETQVLPNQKPSSVRAVRSHLKCYIIPELGTVGLEQFGVENQQTFINRMPERSSKKIVSRKTVLNVLGTLSTILTTARDWGYNCQQIDVTKLRLPPRGARHEAPHFTVDQLQCILMLAEDPWRTLFCISTMEGLRAGEVLGLQWGDIDFDRRLLYIRRSAWYGKVQTAKSEASETVLPIPDALLDWIRTEKSVGCWILFPFFFFPLFYSPISN